MLMASCSENACIFNKMDVTLVAAEDARACAGKRKAKTDLNNVARYVRPRVAKAEGTVSVVGFEITLKGSVTTMASGKWSRDALILEGLEAFRTLVIERVKAGAAVLTVASRAVGGEAAAAAAAAASSSEQDGAQSDHIAEDPPALVAASTALQLPGQRRLTNRIMTHQEMAQRVARNTLGIVPVRTCQGTLVHTYNLLEQEVNNLSHPALMEKVKEMVRGREEERRRTVQPSAGRAVQVGT